jgi:hypothetical protein
VKFFKKIDARANKIEKRKGYHAKLFSVVFFYQIEFNYLIVGTKKENIVNFAKNFANLAVK